ncbi:hypothetical protein TAMA11512_18360 [Selenomonas sp. TAMA-11512]|uniref:heavy-metal-associated domain-containing protein n=1 Tax=Selenomonas sp. TAMA-11512 TaxID=3095337 RepID=UPI0030933E36|nr:hypothetical protein TAMA11512_18360 [Selenomonas sp. TAMA-11512]
MATYILLAVIVVAVCFALRSMMGHFKGEGACCAGGGTIAKGPAKKLEGKVIGEKIISIEGMHCANCEHAVTRLLSSIEGASAEVSLSKKRAVLRMVREVPDEEIHSILDRTEYRITGIEVHTA